MSINRYFDIKTYFAFVRNEFKDLSIYKLSFWMGFFYTFLMMYSVGYVWRSLYASNPDVTGVSLDQMISYAVLGVALEAVMHPARGPQTYIMDQVRKGSIELDILKPIDFQFQMFYKNTGNMSMRFLFMVLPSVVIAYFLFSLQLPTLINLLGFIVSLLLAFLVSFMLSFMLGLISMITMNIKNINFGYNALLRFFSGQLVPLWIFPSALQSIGNFLPFQCIYSIPMSIYIGNYVGMEICYAVGIQLFWVLFLWLLSRLLMKKAFNKLMVQGG